MKVKVIIIKNQTEYFISGLISKEKYDLIIETAKKKNLKEGGG
jgi:hypothetical protein